MGLRFRKSIKIAPGLKLNINKNSMGITMGKKGYHLSVNSKGRVTRSFGIPGTGISYVDTYNLNDKNTKYKNTNKKTSTIQNYVNTNTYPNSHKKEALPKLPFYKKSWFTIFFLMFCFPFGLFSMWKFSVWKKSTKTIISSIYIIMLICCIVASINV